MIAFTIGVVGVFLGVFLGVCGVMWCDIANTERTARMRTERR